VAPNPYQWQSEFDFGERGEVEGANEEELKFFDHQDLHAQYQDHHIGGHGYQGFHDNQAYMNLYQEDKLDYYTESSCAPLVPPLVPRDHVMPSSTDNHLVQPPPNGTTDNHPDLMSTWPPKGQAAEPMSSPRNLDNYRVAYKGANSMEKAEASTSTPPKEPKDGYHNYQEEFLQQSELKFYIGFVTLFNL
jgi:hypothetical protein